MSAYPYVLSQETPPRLGLIVLQVDETIEDDFHQMIAPGQARLHVTRIPSGAKLNADTIRSMETALPAAAGLLPEAVAFDAVGYGCTSGTTLIGAARVRDLVRSGCRAGAVSDPLTATFAAIRALGLARVGIVSPYIAPVAEDLRAAFEAAGVAVPAMLTFGEETEANVARISKGSIMAAARDLAGRDAMDGLFLSCTNLRTLDLIAPLEAELGLPVLSSNQTLAWHLSCLADARAAVTVPGRLNAVPTAE